MSKPWVPRTAAFLRVKLYITMESTRMEADDILALLRQDKLPEEAGIATLIRMLADCIAYSAETKEQTLAALLDTTELLTLATHALYEKRHGKDSK